MLTLTFDSGMTKVFELDSVTKFKRRVRSLITSMSPGVVTKVEADDLELRIIERLFTYNHSFGLGPSHSFITIPVSNAKKNAWFGDTAKSIAYALDGELWEDTKPVSIPPSGVQGIT